jgi:hypothetical protein
MAEEIPIRRRLTEAESSLPQQQEDATSVYDGAAIRPAGINPYLYENLVSNVESQLEHWNRKAARQQQTNPERARELRLKAEGLGYTLRLLKAFEPEFRELTDAAIRSGGERGMALHP